MDIESKLNNLDVPEMEKIGLVFTNDEQGKLAAKDCLARLKDAVVAGTIPDDFFVSKETLIRQTRARTTLWNSNNQNFGALKNIKNSVLLAEVEVTSLIYQKIQLLLQIKFLILGPLFLRGACVFVSKS